MASERSVNLIIRAQERADRVFQALEQRLGRSDEALARMQRQLEALNRTARDTSFGKLSREVITLNQASELLTRGLAAARSGLQALAGPIERAARVEDLSRRLQLGAEAVQRLDFAARQAGTSLPALAPALKQLALGITEAQRAGSALHRFFTTDLRASRAELEALARASPDRQLLFVVERMNQLTASTRKTTAEVKLFGKGFEQVRLLAAEGIDQLRRNLEELPDRLGLVFTDDQIRRAKAYQDAVGELRGAWDGLMNSLARGGLSDELTRGVQLLTAALTDEDVHRALQGLVAGIERLVARAIETLPDVVRAFRSLGQALSENLDLVVDVTAAWAAYKAAVLTAAALDATIEGFRALSDVLTAARTAQLGLNAAMLANPALTAFRVALSVAAAAAAYFGVKALAAQAGIADFGAATSEAADALVRVDGDAAARELDTAEAAAARSIGTWTRLKQAVADYAHGLSVIHLGRAADIDVADPAVRAQLEAAERSRGLTAPERGALAAFRARQRATQQIGETVGSMADIEGMSEDLDQVYQMTLLTQEGLDAMFAALAQGRDVVTDFGTAAQGKADGFREAIARLQRENAVLRGELSPTTAAIEEMVASLEKQARAAGVSTDGIRALVTEHVRLVEREQEIADLAAQYDAMGKRIVQAADEIRTAVETNAVELTILARGLGEEEAALLRLREKYRDTPLANPEDLAILEQQTVALIRQRRELEASLDLGAVADRAVDTITDALARGQIEWAEVGDSLKTILVGSMIEGAKDAIAAKVLHLDGPFRLNIVNLVKGAGEVLTGRRGLGDLFGAAAGAGVESAEAIDAAYQDAMRRAGATAVDTAQVVSAAGDQASGGWLRFFDVLLSVGTSTFTTLIGLALRLAGLAGGIAALVSGTGGAGAILGIVGGVASSLSESAKTALGVAGLASRAGGISTVLGGLGGIASLAGGALSLAMGGDTLTRLGGVAQLGSGLYTLGGIALQQPAIATVVAQVLAQLGFTHLAYSAALTPYAAGTAAAGAGGAGGSTAGLGAVALPAAVVAGAVVAALNSREFLAGSAVQQQRQIAGRAGFLPGVNAALTPAPILATQAFRHGDVGRGIFQALDPVSTQVALLGRSVLGPVGGTITSALFNPVAGIYAVLDALGIFGEPPSMRDVLRDEFRERTAGLARLPGPLAALAGRAGLAQFGEAGLRRPDLGPEFAAMLRGGGASPAAQRRTITSLFGSVLELLRQFNQFAEATAAPGARGQARLSRGLDQLGDLFAVAGVDLGGILAGSLTGRGRVDIRGALAGFRDAVLPALAAGAPVTRRQLARIGDPFTLAAFRLDRRSSDAIDVFGLAQAIAAEDPRARPEHLTRRLGAGVGIQDLLVRAGLPQLALDEATAFASTVGRPRGRRFRIGAAGVQQAIGMEQFVAGLEAQRLGTTSAVAAGQADRQLAAAEAAVTAVDRRLPRLRGRQLDAALQERGQAVAAAQQAAQAWGDTVLGLVEAIREGTRALEDFRLQAALEQATLRDAADTRSLYNDILVANEKRFDALAAKGGSAAAQLDVVTRQMDLLRAAAQAEIRDVQRAAEKAKEVHETRLEAIDKELEGVQALAAVAESARNALKVLRAAGDTTGLLTAGRAQEDLARAQAEFAAFGRSGDLVKQAGAAQRVVDAAMAYFDATAAAFGPLGAETDSARRAAIAAVDAVLPVLEAAERRRDELQEEQADLLAQIRQIDEDTQHKIDEINAKLADALEIWAKRATVLQEQRNAQLLFMLGGLVGEFVKTPEQFHALLEDPLLAQLAVQQVMAQKLAGIEEATRKLANLPKRATGGPVFAGRDYLVGERGLEIFRAPASGEIVPLDRGRAGDARPSQVINLNVTVQPAKGEPMARARLFGRAVVDAIDAEIAERNMFGAGSRRVRQGVR